MIFQKCKNVVVCIGVCFIFIAYIFIVVPISITGEIIMSKKSTKKKRKKEKKLRKNKLKCASCGGKMQYTIIREGANGEGEFFVCKKCGKKAEINRMTRVKKQKAKQNRLALPSTQPRNVDNDNLVYEMIFQKLQDKYYDIEHGCKYNPIIMKLDLKGKITDVSDDEHKNYTHKILKDLKIID